MNRFSLKLGLLAHFFIQCTTSSFGQDRPDTTRLKSCFLEPQPLPTLSVSVNPAGFLFFGPTVDVSIGLRSNLAVTAGFRSTTQSPIVKKLKKKSGEFDQLNGSGLSLGIVCFTPKVNHKLYVGAQLGFDKLHVDYSTDEPWEWYEDAKTYHLGGNIGIRSYVAPRVYLNTGLFLGGMISNYDWDYSDTNYGMSDPESRSGTKIYPNGMLEIAIGYRIR